MDQIRKAWDTLVAANFERQDLSSLISLQDGPIRPILQQQTLRANVPVPAVGSVPARGKLHYWDEIGLNSATGFTAGYQEGGKPGSMQNAPTQLTNVIARFGRTAAVTDTEAAVWTGSGSYSLQEGELERLYRDALDLATELSTTEVLNEIEWCWINGDTANNTAVSIPSSPNGASITPVVSQFNGLLKILSYGTAPYGGATIIDAAAAPYNGNFTEQILRDAGRRQAAQKTPYRPDLLLVSDGQMEIINTFHPAQITMATDGMTGGAATDFYHTGFFKVGVAYEPQLPSGTALMLCTSLLKNVPLIKLGAEPLARVQTQLERMITCEQTIEVRVQKAHIVLKNLPV